MAIVLLGTVLAALISVFESGHGAFGLGVTLILLVTVLFANFAEAVAEARGRGQAASLRAARRDLVARKLTGGCLADGETSVAAATLRPGDLVVVSEGEFVPADGEIVEGVATINEAAVTGDRRRCFARPAPTAPASSATPACCPTRSSCGSGLEPGQSSWTG